MSFHPNQAVNLVTRLFAFPKSQTLKFNSGATVLALCQSAPGMRSTAPGSLHLPAVPRTPAHSLCRYRSRRGGDREAPPWGRSRWSGRKSLGRCAPAAASEPHTCQRRGSSASPRVEEGAPGGRAQSCPCCSGAGAAGTPCPGFPGQSPAPCRPRPGAGSLPPWCQ